MSATIINQAIAAIDDQRISMVNAQFGRPHGLGTGWNTLRIAMRCIWDDAVSQVTLVGQSLYVGLCSGTTNMIGDATTANSVGLSIYFSNCAFSPAGAGTAASIAVPTTRMFTRVGSTLSVAGTSYNFLIPADLTTANRCMIFFDLVRGSPNFSVANLFYRDNGTNQDVSLANYLAQANSPTPAFTRHTRTAAPTGWALAVNEGLNGTLDTVNVCWGSLAVPFCISDLACVVIA